MLRCSCDTFRLDIRHVDSSSSGGQSHLGRAPYHGDSQSLGSHLVDSPDTHSLKRLGVQIESRIEIEID